MTREEEITKRIFEVVALKEPNPHSFPFENWLYSAGYMDGAKWADSHPHWISVEDELPPISGWTTSDDVLAVVKVGSDIRMVVLRYDYEVMAWDNPNEVTHWMPLPKMPVLSNSGKIGKDLEGGEE